MPGDVVRRTIRAHRREDSKRDTECHRDEHGKENELERGWPVDGKIVQYRPPGEDGAAPVSLNQPAQVVPVLNGQRIIEPELLPDLLVHLGGRLCPGRQSRGVSRHDPRQRERQQRHPEQCRDDE